MEDHERRLDTTDATCQIEQAAGLHDRLEAIERATQAEAEERKEHRDAEKQTAREMRKFQSASTEQPLPFLGHPAAYLWFQIVVFLKIKKDLPMSEGPPFRLINFDSLPKPPNNLYYYYVEQFLHRNNDGIEIFIAISLKGANNERQCFGKSFRRFGFFHRAQTVQFYRL